MIRNPAVRRGGRWVRHVVAGATSIVGGHVGERSNLGSKSTGWIALLLLFGIASTIEASPSLTFSASCRFNHRDGARAAGGGAGLDRVLERGVLPLLRLPLVPFVGRLGNVTGASDHRPQRLCRDGGLCVALVRAEPMQPRLDAARGLPAREHGRELTALRSVTPAGVWLAISLFGVSPPSFRTRTVCRWWLVDHGVLNLHTLFAVDAVLSLAAASILLAFAARAHARPPPAGSAVRLALGALRTALTDV